MSFTKCNSYHIVPLTDTLHPEPADDDPDTFRLLCGMAPYVKL